MKTHPILRQRGFTLLETVIAIGVLAVLLTGFMVVFAPAAEGIRKSINVQQADRMASALEQELVTLRKNEIKPPDVTTGFDKSFEWIKSSSVSTSTDALLAYQYRAKIKGSPSNDGTPTPEPSLSGKPGEDYVVVPMVRRLSDTNLQKDLDAVEGAVYLVKCTQLVFGALPTPPGGTGLITGKTGEIKNPKPDSTPADPNYKAGPFAKASEYPEAVIAFAADFYLMPAKSYKYFTSTSFKDKFPKLKNPVFTRNLAVRR